MATLIANNILPLGSTLGFGCEILVNGGATFSSGITVGSGSVEQMTIISGISVADLSAGNVAPVYNNTIQNNLPVVGCVLPIWFPFLGRSGVLGSTFVNSAIPSGKWFVYGKIREVGSPGGIDEDMYAVMAQVWDIPSGQYLRFVMDGLGKGSNIATDYGYTSGIWYKIGTESNLRDIDSYTRSDLESNGWTEFVVGTNCRGIEWNEEISYETTSGLFVAGTNTNPGSGTGYAWRIG